MTNFSVFLPNMPGEPVGHVYAGPMATETVHFVEAVALDRPVLVTPDQARRVMDLCWEIETLPIASALAEAASA